MPYTVKWSNKRPGRLLSLSFKDKFCQKIWVQYRGRGRSRIFHRGATLVKVYVWGGGGEVDYCLITKICELAACFLYFSYVLAQNGKLFTRSTPPGSALAILCDKCLKSRIFTAKAWLINYFSPSVFVYFWKPKCSQKRERKKLQILLISLKSYFRFWIQFLSSRIISPVKFVCQ